MNDKINFISLSIADIQSTIRAVDTKIGILIVFICFPLTNLSKIFSNIANTVTDKPVWFIYIIVAGFTVSWICSIMVSIRAISAIDNPSTHIINSSDCNGSFYGGYLYSPSIIDAVFNRDRLKASKDVVSQCELIPDDINIIEKELVFEQMKLIYIREIKLNRLKWSLRFTFTWLSSGLLLYLISHYIKS